MSKFILAIDQGTTGTTAALVNSIGTIVAKVDQDFAQIYPQPGWVEHDPEVIWKTVCSTIDQVLQKAKVKGSEISAIGITNQRETVVVWDRKTGKPIYNAIVWQCRRTAPFCEKIKKYQVAIKRKTGLVVDPYFSASKIRWILDHVSGAHERAAQGELACGTIDSFLLWRLTGGTSHATDVTNASRTQLMNIETGKWDAQLLKIFAVPEKLLPVIKASNDHFGLTQKNSQLQFSSSVLPEEIVICGMAGDQQSALFGQACFEVGEAKVTYGTGSFLLLNTGTKKVHSKSGVLTTVAWKLRGQKKMTYALEGSAFICGAAVQWLRDSLGMISSSSEVETLARSVGDCAGVQFVPAFTGLGAPYWDPYARATITGLTRGANRAHIARATLEGMALQNVDLLLAMQKDLGKKIKLLRVDGGASENNLLMQMQSDFLGVMIDRPKMVETTVAGAAFLAGLGAGIWKSQEEIKKIWVKDMSFQPKIKDPERAQRILEWHQAIAQTVLPHTKKKKK